MESHNPPCMLLKVMSIIFIGSGTLSVVVGLLAIVLVDIIHVPVTMSPIAATLYGAFAVATGLIEFFAGRFGLKGNYVLGNIFGWVIIILSALTLLGAVLSSRPLVSVVAAFISLALPVLYFMGINRSETGHVAPTLPERPARR